MLIIKKYFLLLLGFLICFFVIFIRFILKRIPHEIDFSWNILKFLIYLALFLLFSYILKKQLYPKESKNKVFIWIKETFLLKIIIIYEASLKEVYNFFFFSKITRILEKLLYKVCIFISKIYTSKIFTQSPTNRMLIYYIFTIIPRLIIVITLFIDVIIFNKYYYMYKLIWLLIVPLLFKFIYFLIEEFHKIVWEMLNSYFIIELCNNTVKWGKKDTDFTRAYPLSPEDSLKFAKDISRFIIINHFFLLELNSEGPFTNTKFYKMLKKFIIIIYIIVFGFLTYRYGISYFNKIEN